MKGTVGDGLRAARALPAWAIALLVAVGAYVLFALAVIPLVYLGLFLAPGQGWEALGYALGAVLVGVFCVVVGSSILAYRLVPSSKPLWALVVLALELGPPLVGLGVSRWRGERQARAMTEARAVQDRYVEGGVRTARSAAVPTRLTAAVRKKGGGFAVALAVSVDVRKAGAYYVEATLEEPVEGQEGRFEPVPLLQAAGEWNPGPLDLHYERENFDPQRGRLGQFFQYPDPLRERWVEITIWRRADADPPAGFERYAFVTTLRRRADGVYFPASRSSAHLLWDPSPPYLARASEFFVH